MKFTVTLDRDEDGVWVVECPAIPGCVSQGKTKQEAIENIADAIKLDCAATSRLLDRLEAKHLVARRPNPAHRRSVIVEATEEFFSIE